MPPKTIRKQDSGSKKRLKKQRTEQSNKKQYGNTHNFVQIEPRDASNNQDLIDNNVDGDNMNVDCISDDNVDDDELNDTNVDDRVVFILVMLVLMVMTLMILTLRLTLRVHAVMMALMRLMRTM